MRIVGSPASHVKQPLTTPLTESESSALVQHEDVIEGGLAVFVEVGKALLAIRDERLYRADYETFEVYCFERWDIKKSQAYRLMDAAAVVENVSPIGDIVPRNEAQARPLSRLPQDDQQGAWAEAVETAPNGKITAKHVEAVVERYAGSNGKAKPVCVPWSKIAVNLLACTNPIAEVGGIEVASAEWLDDCKQTSANTLKRVVRTLEEWISYLEN